MQINKLDVLNSQQKIESKPIKPDVIAGTSNTEEGLVNDGQSQDFYRQFVESCGVYFEHPTGKYWRESIRGSWFQSNEQGAMRYVKSQGFSARTPKGGCISEADMVLKCIQETNDILWAGALAGYRMGLQEVCGQRILITKEAKPIKPEKRPWEMLHQLLFNLLGPEQLLIFCFWLKISIESLMEQSFRPGQCPVFAGPAGCGKSFVQNHIITPALGGRSARPYRYMSGETTFNEDVLEAEHLIVEDDMLSRDARSRRAFGAQMKAFAVNETHSLHGKHKKAVTVKPFTRMTVSVNDEDDNLVALPHMEENFMDKVILFEVNPGSIPVDTSTMEARKQFAERISQELPGFIYYLINDFQAPDHIKDSRYGVISYHNPNLLAKLRDLSSEAKLLELISTAIRPSGEDKCWKGTAEDLSATLETAYTPHIVRTLFPYSNSAGSMLARLAQQQPRRIFRKKTNGRTLWYIFEHDQNEHPNLK